MYWARDVQDLRATVQDLRAPARDQRARWKTTPWRSWKTEEDQKLLARTATTRRHALIEFYGPGASGHCQALAPGYAAAVSDLTEQGLGVALAKVNTTKDADIEQEYDVQGFPTLNFFVDGVHKDYSSKRT